MTSRILVIEDEPKWYKLFQRILKGMGYEVDVAENSSKAVASLGNSKYDLVLLDVCLDRDGFDFFCQQFCHSLRQRYPDLPVVATTGRKLKAQELETLFELGGVDDFMHKHRLQLPAFRRRIQTTLRKSGFNTTQIHDTRALLIGVGDYLHPGFSSLPTTVRDAQAIAAVLIDPARCGYPSANVHVLTGEQTTAATIRTAHKNLAESTTPESTVFIFFSGHGGRALENGVWRTYLCPREADPDDLAQTAISGDEFSALLAAIPARKLLVMLDACHAAGSAELKAADGTVVWKIGLPDNYYEALSQGSGHVVIASSKEDQFSYVHGELSLFTNHLVQALNGKAAVRGDGLIHVLDVFHYVNEAVQADEPKQVPILKVKDLDLNFAIALDRGGEGTGLAISVTPITDIREQIVRDPIGGAKALSEYLKTRPEWAAKRNEVDLKRTELERIQHELDLFGPDPGNRAAKNRAVYFLLRVCLELERPEEPV